MKNISQYIEVAQVSHKVYKKRNNTVLENFFYNASLGLCSMKKYILIITTRAMTTWKQMKVMNALSQKSDASSK